MNNRLSTLWQARAPREKTAIIVVAALVGIVLYALLLVSANSARPRLRSNVVALQADVKRLDQLVSEVERLRTLPPVPESQIDLRTLVQAQVGSAGLTNSLVRLDAPEANRVQLVFGAIAFADWVNWVVALNAQNVRLDTCRIESLAKPGMVSVTATLVRAGRK